MQTGAHHRTPQPSPGGQLIAHRPPSVVPRAPVEAREDPQQVIAIRRPRQLHLRRRVRHRPAAAEPSQLPHLSLRKRSRQREQGKEDGPRGTEAPYQVCGSPHRTGRLRQGADAPTSLRWSLFRAGLACPLPSFAWAEPRPSASPCSGHGAGRDRGPSPGPRAGRSSAPPRRPPSASTPPEARESPDRSYPGPGRPRCWR